MTDYSRIAEVFKKVSRDTKKQTRTFARIWKRVQQRRRNVHPKDSSK